MKPPAEPDVKLEQVTASPFIGHLPQGTIELVGVAANSDDPNGPLEWWQPDRAPLDKSRFPPGTLPSHALSTSSPPGPGLHLEPRLFLVRFKDLPADASPPEHDFSRAYYETRGRGGTYEQLMTQRHGDDLKDTSGKIVPGYKLLEAQLRGTTVDLQIGVGAGAWVTVARQRADIPGRSTFEHEGRKWTVTFETSNGGTNRRPHAHRCHRQNF